MTGTLQLGPLVLPLPLLLGAAAFILAGLAGRRLSRDHAVELDR